MTLRILLLEDVPADAALIERHLTKSGLDFVSRRVDTRARFEEALQDFVPDIILSDHGLPGFDGSAALELVKERFPALPVVLVTGSLNEETAVDFIKAGAADYILKDHLTRLPQAIHRALDEKRLREEREQAVAALRESEPQYRSLFENTPYPMWVFDLETHRVLAVNGAAIRHYGYAREEPRRGSPTLVDRGARVARQRNTSPLSESHFLRLLRFCTPAASRMCPKTQRAVWCSHHYATASVGIRLANRSKPEGVEVRHAREGAGVRKVGNRWQVTRFARASSAPLSWRRA
jgi:CheY-like chemotaxis protein